MFHAASLMLLNKCSQPPHLEFDANAAIACARGENRRLRNGHRAIAVTPTQSVRNRLHAFAVSEVAFARNSPDLRARPRDTVPGQLNPRANRGVIQENFHGALESARLPEEALY